MSGSESEDEGSPGAAMLSDPRRMAELQTVGEHFYDSLGACHETPFTALDELVDNARDQGAARIEIEWDRTEGSEHILVTDSGGRAGLDADGVLRMLQLGSAQPGGAAAAAAAQRIGKHGMGVKHAIFRIAREIVVFARARGRTPGRGGDERVTVALMSRGHNSCRACFEIPIARLRPKLGTWCAEDEPSEQALRAIEERLPRTLQSKNHSSLFRLVPAKPGLRYLFVELARDIELLDEDLQFNRERFNHYYKFEYLCSEHLKYIYSIAPD